MSISVMLWCLSADLRVPRITVSASWARRLWQICWTSWNTSISMCPMDTDCEVSSTAQQTFASTALRSETHRRSTKTWPPLIPDVDQRADACVCICTNWCSSVREVLNWSEWLSKHVLITILYSFPVFDAGKQETPMKKRVISFIWHYVIAIAATGLPCFFRTCPRHLLQNTN